jgi:hypothetical protein
VHTLRSGKVWQIWCFSMFFSILLPLSRNLTPSLRTTSYVHESRRWQTFSLFALSELVCTKNIFYPILLLPLLSHPKLNPFWSIPDGQTNFNTPCSLSSFFFHWACGALPAGATLLGWPNYGVALDGRLNKVKCKGHDIYLPFWWWLCFRRIHWSLKPSPPTTTTHEVTCPLLLPAPPPSHGCLHELHCSWRPPELSSCTKLSLFTRGNVWDGGGLQQYGWHDCNGAEVGMVMNDT